MPLSVYTAFPEGGGSLAATSGASMSLISTVTANNSASVNIEGLTNSYDVYVINCVNLSNVADQNFAARMQYNGSYLTTEYEWAGFYNQSNSVAWNGGGSANDTRISQLAFSELTSTSRANMEITIFNPSSVSTRNIVMIRASTAASTLGQRYITARNNSTIASSNALTGIQIFGQNGTNFSGTFRLYGIKNS
jgi:hypothetical protein